MTRKELEREQEKVRVWKRNGTLTVEQKRLDDELWCREMINSILCYHDEKGIMENQYLKRYILNLGHRRVLELVNEQIEDFRKAVVLRNCATDSEGCSYNAIVWADEQAV